jgi:excinuclease ABC subunit C
MFNIKNELKNIPDSPGIYLMKNSEDNIIYIGKAKNLKKRIKQYFQSNNHSYKIQKMIQNIASFEYILTDSEIEALMLEANFIKKHKPKYNTMLIDDKMYPYIKVTVKEKFPRIMKVRQVNKDGSKYFGPYTSAFSVKHTIDSIRSIFKIRSCNLKIITGKENSRPCLNYYINRCFGPCIGKINSEEYMKIIEEIIELLNGREDRLVEELEKRMDFASENLDFEHAAEYRDRILAIKNLSEKQKITKTSFKDSDVIGTAIGDNDAIVQIFFVRSGKIIGKEDYLLKINLEDSAIDILESFIKQYYSGSVYVPKEIYIESEINDIEIIAQWLSSKRGNKVEIKSPQKGEKSMLVKMVKKNAQEKLEKDVQKIKARNSDNMDAVDELAELIGFDKKIERIEAYDISNIQGVENVGSMVVFEAGELRKGEYRRFRIRNVYGQNDYKSMEEMLDRRISRGMSERSRQYKENKFSRFPDLILIDGGKGHVRIVEEVLSNYGLKIPVCGMVKDEKHTSRGLVYNGKEIMLLKNTKLYRLISSIQNEVHRFAISYHRDLRKKTLFKTVLDDIEGIGEKRKLSLLKEFGSVEGIKAASIESLTKAPVMNRKTAEKVYEFFRNQRGEFNENYSD